MNFYHYTLGIYIDNILDAGVIGYSRTIQPIGYLKTEKPSIWVSTNEYWENSVRKVKEDPNNFMPPNEAMEMNYLYGKGLFRIQIDPTKVKLIDWNTWKRTSGINKKYASNMEQVSKKWGANPNEAYCTYDMIPRDSWIKVQKFDMKNKIWVDIENL